MKKLTIITLFIFALFTLAACGSNDDDLNQRDNDQNEDINGEESSDEDLREFTLEELSQYDGLDGNDAYVAVDGYVYDMTNSSYWIDGNHQGRVQAGQDLTDEINDSPHGRSTLERVPKIGILVDDTE